MWYTHHIGGYPHPDVPRVPKTALVQGEIYYCPDLKFIAYDVVVTHGTDRGRYIEEDLIHCMYQPWGLSRLRWPTVEPV